MLTSSALIFLSVVCFAVVACEPAHIVFMNKQNIRFHPLNTQRSFQDKSTTISIKFQLDDEQFTLKSKHGAWCATRKKHTLPYAGSVPWCAGKMLLLFCMHNICSFCLSYRNVSFPLFSFLFKMM